MINAIKHGLPSVFLCTVFAAAPGAENGSEPSPQNVLEESPEPLISLRTRSESQSDRLHAGALYATGRTLFQRGDAELALRHFQRAWRWDPAASFMLSDIVPLAFSLNRPEEAVRYALLAAQAEDTDALLLRRLALYVTEQGDWSRAVQLYRKWLSHADVRLSRDRFSKLLVQLEIGRLEYLVDNNQAASQALGEFQIAVLQANNSSSLAKSIRRALGDDLNATWELCSLAHLDAGAFDLASQALDHIDLPLAESGRLGYLKAQAAAGRGDTLAAWQHLRDYFQAGYVQDGDKPYQLLEQILRQLHQGDSFLLELAKLQQQDPQNAALALALASQFERQQQIPRAVELYRSIVDAADRSPDETVVRAVSRLIALYGDRGQTRELLQLLSLAADRLEGLADFHELVSEIPQHPGLVDRLVELADEVDSMFSTGPQSLVMAALLLGAEKFAAADQFYQSAIAASPDDADALTLGWGLGLLMAEQYRSAAEVFQKGIDNRPGDSNDSTLEYYLAMALELDERTEQAIVVARKGAVLQPDSAEIAGRLPWVFYHAERYEEAREAYRQFLDRFDANRDRNTRDELREARFVLSNLEVLAGNFAAGEEWLEQVLDEFPENVGAMNDLGYLWADQNKHLHRARTFIEQAVAAKPQNAAYRDSLGWVLYRLGRFDQALTELETAVRLSRTPTNDESEIGDADGIMLDHLGDVQLALGHIDEAVQSWQRALPGLEVPMPQKAADIRKKIEMHQSQIHD